MPKIDSTTQNFRLSVPKNTNSERYTKMGKRIEIGKTYTPAVVNRKSHAFKNEKNLDANIGIDSEKDKFKLPIFNNK